LPDLRPAATRKTTDDARLIRQQVGGDELVGRPDANDILRAGATACSALAAGTGSTLATPLDRPAPTAVENGTRVAFADVRACVRDVAAADPTAADFRLMPNRRPNAVRAFDNIFDNAIILDNAIKA
jgi:hypothetical protein